MTRTQIEAIVAANAAGLDLALAAEHRPGVVAFFALAAEMATLVDGLPLTIDDETGSVFMPAAPGEAP
jgi:hypothetical protein